MHPILLTFGPFVFYTSGIFLSVALIIGSFIVWREGVRVKLDEEKLISLILWELTLGLLGARIYYILFHLKDFISINPFYWILIFHFPGLSFVGGILGGLLGVAIFAAREHLSFFQAGDISVLGLALAEVFGAIGSFFSGTAYGSLTKLPWGVYMVGLIGKRHPTQIYEAILSLIIFLVLLGLKKRLPKNTAGFLMLTYLMLYGLTNFFLENLRGKVVSLGNLNVGQIADLIFLVSSAIVIYKRSGRSAINDFNYLFDKIKRQK